MHISNSIGVLDFDVTLYIEKSVAITETSSVEERSYTLIISIGIGLPYQMLCMRGSQLINYSIIFFLSRFMNI